MADDERLVFRVATPWFWWTIYETGQTWNLWRILYLLIFLVLSPVLIVIALLAVIFSKPAKRTPDEVARYLWNEAQDRSDFRDWDDFTSIPIADPNLDAIRAEAASIPTPLADHRDELLALAEKARQLR
jgi:hypothetical protein